MVADRIVAITNGQYLQNPLWKTPITGYVMGVRLTPSRVKISE